MRVNLIRLLQVAAMLILMSGCSAPPQPSQLSVNGQQVSLALYRGLVAAEQQKIERSGIRIGWTSASGRHRLAQLQSSVIRQLVRSRVIEQLARARGLSVSPDEAGWAMARVQESLGGSANFAAALAQAGTAETTFAQVLRDHLLEAKLRQALGSGFAHSLDRALSSARVVATVGPCDGRSSYPSCLVP
jgi:SurA N-terminal domain